MALGFVKNGASVSHTGVDSIDEGQTIAVPAVFVSRLFTGTTPPAVGNVIRFAGPPDNWTPSVKRSGQDFPVLVSFDGTTYIFGVANGVVEFIVTTVNPDGSIVVTRGAT